MKRYLLNLLISIDQLGNTLCGGDPDETISSHVGRGAIAGKWWALMVEPAIDGLFFILCGQVGHCRAHIERH